MFKNFKKLDRAEKIDLLKMIASGEVGRNDIDEETSFATKPEDAFVSMLSRLTGAEKGITCNILEIGEAREEMKQSNKFMEEVLEKYPELAQDHS